MEINYNDSFVNGFANIANMVFVVGIGAAFVAILVMIYLAFFKGGLDND